MAKIKTTVWPHANGQVDAEILQAAAAAMPNSNPSAEVIRDLNGKVVEVHVNLPDGDAPGLANAKNAINSNSGVAKASEFPKDIANDDFNSLTPGDVLATMAGPNPYIYDGGLGNSGSIEVTGFPGETDVLRAAFSSEADGASALMYQPRNASASTQAGGSIETRFPGVSNNFDPPVSYETELDLLLPSTVNSVACDTPSSFNLEMRFYVPALGSNELILRKGNADSNFKIESQGATPTIDTGIAVGSSHDIKVRMVTTAGGSHIVTIDGNVFVVDKSATFGPRPDLYWSALYAVQHATSAIRNADEHPPMIIDNLRMTILA
jgi:hypothetical protein